MSFIWNMLRVKGLKEKGGYRKGGKSWGVKDFTVIQDRRCMKQKQQAITYLQEVKSQKLPDPWSSSAHGRKTHKDKGHLV